MYKVLVVDDEKELLEIYQHLLSPAGFDILTASNGDDAIKLATKGRPQLILLDIVMPGKDGTEVAAALAKNEITKNIPIIFLTGIVTEEEIESKKISGRPCISKTADKNELIAKMKEVMFNR